MHPQRNLIETAELINLNEFAPIGSSKPEKPSGVYDYDKHESSWNEFKQSDEYKQMRRDAFHPVKGPNMENMQKIHDKHKEMHPMGYHVQAAHTELLSYMESPKFKALPEEQRVNKLTDTMMRHCSDFFNTVRDHPVHGGLEFHANGNLFHTQIRRMFGGTQLGEAYRGLDAITPDEMVPDKPMGRANWGEDEEEISPVFRRGRAYVTKFNDQHIYTRFPNAMIDGVEGVSVKDPNGPNGYMHVELPRKYKMRDVVHPDHEPSN